MQELRRYASEPALFLGGQRALLLQLAHPKVAAGVEHHSGFRRRPLTRLWSTVDALMCLVWGRPDEAQAARDRILRIHDRVHGELTSSEATAAHPEGRWYDAHDPALLWWVWATLVDTTEEVHRRFLEPLDDATLDALHRDWRELGRFLGIPASELAGDRAAFRTRYLAERGALELSPVARQVAAAVLDPPVRAAPRALRDAYALVAAGLLDERTRALYGVPWGPEQRLRYERVEARIRASWQLVPPWRRELPTAYLAGRRTVVRAWARRGDLSPLALVSRPTVRGMPASGTVGGQ